MHTTANTPAATPAITTAHGYTVSGIKTFTGMEGSGFNANLLRDGKKVAEVIDDASGGPLMIHWADEKATPVKCECRDYKDEMVTRHMTPEEAKLNAYILSLPAAPAGFVGADGKEVVMFPNDEMFIGDLVNDVLTRRSVERRLKSLMKNKIVYIDGGALYTSKALTPAQMAPALVQFKAKKPEFNYLNDKPIEEALALALPLLS